MIDRLINAAEKLEQLSDTNVELALANIRLATRSKRQDLTIDALAARVLELEGLLQTRTEEVDEWAAGYQGLYEYMTKTNQLNQRKG